MTLKSTLSAVAIAAGLAMSVPAFAQTMINGAEVSESDLAVVQAHCDTLKLRDTSDSQAGQPQGDAAAETPVENAQAETDAANTSTSPTVDLDTIDLQACIDAGLVTAN
ncbi:hypothetical protein DEVEQU_03719 [Devosia equisanguinis]|uniref:Secreted protein n=1 Tax=Devosia equisanguinis TaxID=2490941 RepID=A0A3S4EP10_9HYPH|nr:hypothetical protein [Devosia equisanguinis]VDS06555.1 hypothetical protein DEVEQU_03719 [Devosia equisanguinis]